MAKTVTITTSGAHNFHCEQCGKKSEFGVIIQIGWLGVKGPFCCNGCAAAYARDRGWVVK